MTIPAPSRELILRWMESSGGFDTIDIVEQIAIKATAWGYMQQKPGPRKKPTVMVNGEKYEWYHVSLRADCPF